MLSTQSIVIICIFYPHYFMTFQE